MNVEIVVFVFLSIVIMSCAIILNGWMKFADNQIERRQNRINQQKFINSLSNQIKKLNEDITSQKKFKNSNIIIDVECEIVEETNPQAKYLYLNND